MLISFGDMQGGDEGCVTFQPAACVVQHMCVYTSQIVAVPAVGSSSNGAFLGWLKSLHW